MDFVKNKKIHNPNGFPSADNGYKKKLFASFKHIPYVWWLNFVRVYVFIDECVRIRASDAMLMCFACNQKNSFCINFGPEKSGSTLISTDTGFYEFTSAICVWFAFSMKELLVHCSFGAHNDYCYCHFNDYDPRRKHHIHANFFSLEFYLFQNKYRQCRVTYR